MRKSFLSSLQESLKLRTFSAFLLASLLGVLSHFVYEWSGNQRIVGLFFPINESTWEHLKLIFFPIMLVAIPEYFLSSEKDSAFFCIKLKSALLGMLATIVLFYTYQGVLGKNVDWINITIYFVAMIIAYRYSYKKLEEGNEKSYPNLCIFLILILTLMFMIFSVFPPEIGLFKEP